MANYPPQNPLFLLLKADNEHSNPLFYCPSPLNSQHLHFQFTVASLLKILLEVVAIGRKNAGKDPDKLCLKISFFNDVCCSAKTLSSDPHHLRGGGGSAPCDIDTNANNSLNIYFTVPPMALSSLTRIRLSKLHSIHICPLTSPIYVE